jgi:hypothetical protein
MCLNEILFTSWVCACCEEEDGDWVFAEGGEAAVEESVG